jgi:DNA-binding SARP family transcriptional activator/tetratricopeptide (TPR) repeat protein
LTWSTSWDDEATAADTVRRRASASLQSGFSHPLRRIKLEVYRATVDQPGAGVSYSILGSLQVTRAGMRIEPDTPKLRALLVDLLVHHGQTRSADRLIDDLWAGSPPATAPGVLQNYVSQLRKVIAPDVLRRDGTGYVLRITPGQLDRDRFVALVEDARLKLAAGDSTAARTTADSALRLWRGDPLADVAGAAFAEPEVVRLTELREVARETLFEAQLALGGHRELVAALEATLAAEPLRERLWSLLMSALARGGRRADALRAYQRARRTLVDQLGIEPGPELRDLQQAVLHQHDDVAPGTGPRAPAEREPLAGRNVELAAMTAFVAEPAGLLLLSGEPGIGKTRLLEEAQARFPGVVVSGRAYEAERGRPYGPWVDALRLAALPRLTTELQAGLAPLLPELSDTHMTLDDTGRLFDAVVNVLRHARPVLVVLDDLHWLDERSIALLHFAVRTLRGRVAFLASARALELGENRACGRMLESLRRAGAVHDLRVGPLGPAMIDEIVCRVAPRATEIAAVCNGNPLLALEMARAAARGDDPMSGRVDALIGDRLERLSPSAAALVPWLAAFGRSASPDLLAAAARIDADQLVEPLGELEAHGVLAATADGAYDFTHDLVRYVAFRRLSTPRRTMLHRRIGGALLAAPDPDDTLAADAARHADAADDSETCAIASLRSARRCLRLLAYDEASAHVATGRAHARRLSPPEHVALDTQLVDVLIHPALRLNDPGTLATELAELCASAQRLGLIDELSAALTLLARVYHWAWGDIPRARALMRRAVEVTSAAQSQMAEPLLHGARCLAYLEFDMPRTRRLFDELAGLGELAEASHQYHWGRGLVLAWSGDTVGAVAALSTAIRIADTRGDHWAQFECAARLALLQIESGGDPTAACADLEPLATQLGQRGSELAYARAICALARGDEAALHAQVDELHRIDARFLVPDLLGLAAEASFHDGRTDAAAHYAGRALSLAGTVHRPAEAARAHAVLACVMAAQADHAGAREHLAAARAGGANVPHHVHELCQLVEQSMTDVPKETKWQ